MSLHAKGDFDSPVKQVVKPKIVTKVAKQKLPVKGKGHMSVELKAKMEEEKQLKKECDALEYEVSQMEKLQDSIDKFKQKIKELKKRKEGDKQKFKSTKKGAIANIKDVLTKQEIKSVCLPVFEKLNLRKSDQSNSFQNCWNKPRDVRSYANRRESLSEKTEVTLLLCLQVTALRAVIHHRMTVPERVVVQEVDLEVHEADLGLDHVHVRLREGKVSLEVV